MKKTQLKRQIKDLYTVLNFYIENVENSEGYINFIYEMSKKSPIIGGKLKSIEGAREIKKRNLVDEFIKNFDSLDIQEALDIDIQEARRKCKNFDFTIKEKNIILNNFKGNSKMLLEGYDGEVMN